MTVTTSSISKSLKPGVHEVVGLAKGKTPPTKKPKKKKKAKKNG